MRPVLALDISAPRALTWVCGDLFGLCLVMSLFATCANISTNIVGVPEMKTGLREIKIYIVDLPLTID